MNYELVNSHFNTARNFENKLSPTLKKITENLDLLDKYTQSNSSNEMIERDLFNAFYLTLCTLVELKEALYLCDTEDATREKIWDVYRQASSNKIRVKFDSPWCFNCRIFSPPILKNHIQTHRLALTKFYASLADILAFQITSCIPNDFHLFDSAYVIYINHYRKSEAKKQPYFDNDNIAIKSILDIVVPFICVDDASMFCDNLYLSQPDEEAYVDIYIVRKSHLAEWISDHNELDFTTKIITATLQNPAT